MPLLAAPEKMQSKLDARGVVFVSFASTGQVPYRVVAGPLRVCLPPSLVGSA